MKLLKAVSAALLFVVLATQAQTSAQAQSALQDVLNNGVLKVGTI